MCIILALSIVNADSDVTLDKRAANTVLSRQKRHNRDCGGKIWEECIGEGCSTEEVQEYLENRGQYRSYRLSQRIREVFEEER